MMDEFLEYANGDREFAEWLQECDEYCLKVTENSIFDFDDALWRDEYTKGNDPESAVRKLLAEDETFALLLEAFEEDYDTGDYEDYDDEAD